MYYVYVLKNDNGKLYVGYSADLRRRIAEHQRGTVPSTKSGKWELVYYEAYLAKEDAQRRERRLKDARAQYHLRERIQQSMVRGIK